MALFAGWQVLLHDGGIVCTIEYDEPAIVLSKPVVGECLGELRVWHIETEQCIHRLVAFGDMRLVVRVEPEYVAVVVLVSLYILKRKFRLPDARHFRECETRARSAGECSAERIQLLSVHEVSVEVGRKV